MKLSFKCVLIKASLKSCFPDKRVGRRLCYEHNKQRMVWLVHWATYFYSSTKETAFIYAVMAAGLVHSVTRSCSAGNMTMFLWHHLAERRLSEWRLALGGMLHDVQYGMSFSRKFLDFIRNTTAKESKVLLAMNLHNNEAGRQVCIRKWNRNPVPLGIITLGLHLDQSDQIVRWFKN